MTRRRVPVTDPKIAIAYLRVSSDRQELGLEAQRHAIEKWAAKEKVGIRSFHVDEDTPGDTVLDERDGLRAALEELRSVGAGQLVVFRLDRIARDTLLAAMIERLVERDGAVVTSTMGEGDPSTPDGKLMRTFIAGFAQYEKAMIRSRSLAFHARLRAAGRLQGTVPHGYKLLVEETGAKDSQGRPVVVKWLEKGESYKYVARAVELRAEGRSLRAIAAALESEGLTSRRLNPRAVRSLLARASVAV